MDEGTTPLPEYHRTGRPDLITRDAAQDFIGFAIAILDYVFVLSDRFDDFVWRKVAKKAKGVAAGDEIDMEPARTKIQTVWLR